MVVTSSNCFLLVVETGCDQFQTGSYWLLKLAVTSLKWFLLIVETSSNKCKPVSNWLCMTREDECDLFNLFVTGCWKLSVTQFKLVLTACSNWLWLVLADWWNWLWLAQIGSYYLNLFVTGCWNCLWLVQTGSNWLLQLPVTSSNWFLLIAETDFKQAQTQFILVVHDWL